MKISKPKIYIPNAGMHNFSAAEVFGTLVPLSKGKVNILSVGGLYRQFVQLLSSKPDDYILICGPTICNIVACVMFTQVHKKLNLLIYHIGRDGIGRYKRRNLILEGT